MAGIRPHHPLFGFAVFFVFGTFLFFGDRPGAAGGQPIAFNHSVHVASGLECTHCHAGARNDARATLPSLETCLACHENELSENPEEAKLRQLAAAGKELHWHVLTRMPAHVYFSHRRHVEAGGLECAVCHGRMEELTAPPVRPFRKMTMQACMDCHKQNNARNDCNDCHI